MLSKWQMLVKIRRLKVSMNLGIAKIAPFTRIVPKWPRQIVRDWLIKITTPKQHPVSTYRPPKQKGELKGQAGINEYGMFRAENGLAQGAKFYANALRISMIPFTLVNLDYLDFLSQDDHSYDSLISRRGKYAINLININADKIEEACRLFPHRMFDNHYNIGVWLWELERIPKKWVENLRYVDELWAPSEFIAKAIRRETDKPVTVIPYGIETPVEPCKRADFGLPESDFLVLAMYDANSFASRKNPNGAIEAFSKAFSGKKEKATLVLKIGKGSSKEIQALEDRLKSSGIHYFLFTERLPKERLNALIACCDVFISLHRSEGFGLVMAEAMNLGVPVIATGWSANIEFMPRDCTYLVGYHLVPVGNAYHQVDDESSVWAEPDIEEASSYLRMIMEEPEKTKGRAQKAQKHIQEYFSIEASARKMKKRYEELCHELHIQGQL